ncbi:SusD/RagB family nutrient-binding outer membrane lipoprotein [Dyadobacter aurulentus]|uniref:SusD/RagB family nutrient-binding outer membrane lipoprotein n=1 Tax=Dyadobacter sp. UC 10 TaxID=2605428 RepID=UPI0011F0C037|nr:SusD/RagB family nutrient-binding outer membrane lipoprotein [Dyadobacter sp. UC 10]KAA0989506.1 SusD/RagB family nutrient-binding outer membrane lipoprotein [Dyadobacter sp. UC 10]
MKNIKRLWIICVPIILLTGCNNYLDINVDPTLKADATMQELLPTAQFYTGEASYQQAYVACQYSQQLGNAIGEDGIDTYAETDNTLGWSNMYLYVVPQLNAIISKGGSEDAPVYVGVAKVLMAYNLGIATVNWENVPYSQADQKNFSPAYDTQEQIYGTIQKLLDEAIVELAKNTGTLPSSDDLIYNGDAAKWTRLAYSLKARYAMHLSLKNPQQAAQAAIAALEKGMTGNADDFQLQYNSKNLNPWYSRVAIPNTTSNLSVTFTNTFVNLMNGTVQGIEDPRLPKVISLKNNQTVYAGVVPGSGSGSTVDLTAKAWHSNINSPLVMMTYSETAAIKAEALFLLNGGTPTSTGTSAAGYGAYLEMISSNMKKVGVTDADIAKYLAAAPVNVSAAKLTAKHIITEKFKSMLLIGDIWTDIRKYSYLDFPMPVKPNPDLGGSRIQRMRYPDSEITRNSKTVQANQKDPEMPMWWMSK